MVSQHRIYLVAGARPNFMKIAPLWHEFEASVEFVPTIVHTGQHYDYEMSEVFFEELKLPEPDHFLDVGSGTHGHQTGEALVAIEDLLIEARPDMVIVVGDVNSTLAATLAAVKLHRPVAHVEAGLRSFDRSMPEEINRVLTDSVADLLLVSEPSGLENLKAEGVDQDRMHLVGNLMIDSLKSNLDAISHKGTYRKMDLTAKEYGLVTLHRPCNVDSEQALQTIVELLKMGASRRPLVFPIHPRTVKALEKHQMREQVEAIDRLHLTDPLGYFDFVNLMMHASWVMTDSGGIQEETTWLGVPCITLRDNTERPLTVDRGTNILTGLDLEGVKRALAHVAEFDVEKYSPPSLWDGETAGRVADVISSYLREGVAGSDMDGGRKDT